MFSGQIITMFGQIMSRLWPDYVQKKAIQIFSGQGYFKTIGKGTILLVDFCIDFHYSRPNMVNEERISKLTSAVYKVTDLFAEKEPLKFTIRRVCLDVLSLYVSCSETSAPEAKKNYARKGEIQSKIVIKYLSLAEYQDWIDPKNFHILKEEYSLVSQWFSEAFFKAKESMDNKKEFHKKKRQEELSLSQGKASKKEEYILEKNVIPKPFIADTPPIKVEPLFKDLGIGQISTELVNKVDEPIKEIKDKDKMYDIGAAIDYEELSSTQLKILEILQTKKFLKASEVCNYFEDLSNRSVRREIKELRDSGIVITKGSGRSTYYQLNYIY